MSNQGELVLVSTPSMSHILSIVQLAKLILKKTELISISIHIITLSSSYAEINAYVESQLVDNPYPTRLTFVIHPPIRNLPPPSTSHPFATVLELNKPRIKQAIEDRVKAGLRKPVGFIVHMFCSTMLNVANELDVPCYVYVTSGANLLNFQFYAQSLIDDHKVDVASVFSDSGFMGHVPGFKNPVPSKVIPSTLLQKQPWFDLVLNFTRKFREMKGILVNTYVELESFAIQELLDNKHKNIPPVYPVGPILELDNERRGGSDNVEEESLIAWLDGQPKSSVVFLCFGSMGSFDDEQVIEIAKGLDRSGYRFLWSLRNMPPSDNNNILKAFLEGFVDRTCHRGKIIGPAPQVVILSHPAIGGFVTHCGWNSILESLWFGVPMATWPMYAEQQLNAFVLLKELELAVEIRMDYRSNWEGNKGNFLVTAMEIENGVKNLMNMDKKMKERVKKMSDEGKKALQGLSSFNGLRSFIENVFRNVP
ncbi:anthocyanidin 3-O-glucosyltransferase 6-like [Silene latifolia]|uniref:anthocyanidin 3-O-glucosyltransferase 6-like n=1 Tax=Silene latifolia TaxID=37657 RepID=UPI003D786033